MDSGLEFVEDGVSAFKTHTSREKSLQEAFEYAKAKKFDILVIYKIDRFGRRSTESLNMANKFLNFARLWVADKRAEFKGENEIENFVEFWSAKKSSENTKRVVTDAMLNIHEDGFFTGGNPPYGFDNHPTDIGMLIQIPEEAEVVKEIFNLYVNHGLGFLKIAAHLNEKNIKSKTDPIGQRIQLEKLLSIQFIKDIYHMDKTKVVEGEFGAYQKSRKW